MKDYAVEGMRNVVLLGHGSSGKTSLSEAILFDAGAISRLGRVEKTVERKLGLIRARWLEHALPSPGRLVPAATAR